jgi:2-iminobutanoate/2-iminopropanoate deaminase
MSSRRAVSTEKAPKAIGPYSQAIRSDGLVFASGQIPLDPATGELVAGDVRVQTEQVVKNLRAVLEAAGSGLERVLTTTVFMADLKDFAAMNEVYTRHFTAPYPARSTFQVAALPRGAAVEIEAVAEAGE